MKRYIFSQVMKLLGFLLSDTFNVIYVLVTSVTVQNIALYTCRCIVNFILWLTYRLIGSSKSNPVIKVVEKEIKLVPKSKVMSSKEVGPTKTVISESAKEVKIVSMTLITVVLTRVIKYATESRRSLIGSIAESRKIPQ